MNRWSYNPKLGRWYHPTSAVSDNGPDDPPLELEGDGARGASAAPHEPERPTPESLPCSARGAATGAEVTCGCGGRDVRLPVYACALHESCTVPSPGRITRIEGRRVAVCIGCPDRR